MAFPRRLLWVRPQLMKSRAIQWIRRTGLFSAKLAVLAILSLGAACSSTGPGSGRRSGEPPQVPDDPRLSQAQMEELVKAANHGDPDAATRIARHYISSTNDCATAEYWLRKATESGDLAAIENLQSFLELEKQGRNQAPDPVAPEPQEESSDEH